MMDCLYAECTPCITDCVLAELEKLGQKYRVALKVAKVRSTPSFVMTACKHHTQHTHIFESPQSRRLRHALHMADM